jgi:hypothetical protein
MKCTNQTKETTISSPADLEELAIRPGVYLHSDTSSHTWAWPIAVQYCEEPRAGPSGHQD